MLIGNDSAALGRSVVISQRALHSRVAGNPARKCRPTKGGSLSKNTGKPKARHERKQTCIECEKKLQNGKSRVALRSGERRGRISKDVQTTTCQPLAPLIVPLSRQSHFHLRALKHSASVASCLSTGLENPFLPPSLPFRKSGIQLRTTSSNQEVSHRIYFRHPGNFPSN